MYAETRFSTEKARIPGLLKWSIGSNTVQKYKGEEREEIVATS